MNLSNVLGTAYCVQYCTVHFISNRVIIRTAINLQLTMYSIWTYTILQSWSWIFYDDLYARNGQWIRDQLLVISSENCFMSENFPLIIIDKASFLISHLLYRRLQVEIHLLDSWFVCQTCFQFKWWTRHIKLLTNRAMKQLINNKLLADKIRKIT